MIIGLRNLLWIFFGVGLAIFCKPTSVFAAAVTHTISIENMMFNPVELTVTAGDTIIWVNKDLVPHTVTSEKKIFDSKIISPEKSWKIHTHKKGFFSYKCLFHPEMKASFTVK